MADILQFTVIGSGNMSRVHGGNLARIGPARVFSVDGAPVRLI